MEPQSTRKLPKDLDVQSLTPDDFVVTRIFAFEYKACLRSNTEVYWYSSTPSDAIDELKDTLSENPKWYTHALEYVTKYKDHSTTFVDCAMWNYLIVVSKMNEKGWKVVQSDQLLNKLYTVRIAFRTKDEQTSP